MQSSLEKAEVLDSTQGDRWDEFYRLLPDSLNDVNFTLAYQKLFESNGDGNCRLFVYREQDSIYYYPFLLRAVSDSSIPSGYFDIETAYGYTGPLITNHNASFLRNAETAFRNYALDQKIVCEFIRFHPLLKTQENCSEDGSLKIVALRDYVYVDLTAAESSIWNSYSPQNRNKIRKAEKLGLTVYSGFNYADFTVFVSMYLENMRLVNAAKMYFFSEAFFDSLAKLVQNHGEFLTVKQGEEVIAASVFFSGTDIGHYFLAAASPPGKKMAAGNLLLHQGILWAKRKGMKKLHLGGGVSQEAADPLLVFKKNFSQLTEKFYIGKRIYNQAIYETLVNGWDERFREHAPAYQQILQRYRLTSSDLH